MFSDNFLREATRPNNSFGARQILERNRYRDPDAGGWVVPMPSIVTEIGPPIAFKSTF